MAHAARPAVVESYIVRIYRRNPKQRGTLQGVVEDVQSHTGRAFRSVNQLYDAPQRLRGAYMPDDQPLWHPEVLPEGWARAAADLAVRSVLEGFYLAGGTGLALHLGHRRSVDLDLFSETEFASTALRDRLRDLEGRLKLETAPGTVHLQLHGTKVSFLH